MQVVGALIINREAFWVKLADELGKKSKHVHGAAKWCVCFRDVLHESWCYIAIAQTLTLTLRGNHLEIKASIYKPFSYY